jgi:hypothetical protein
LISTPRRLVAHDPKRAPLSANVKYTENDQALPVGDGFWKTAEGRGKYTTSSLIQMATRWASWGR